jgi:hypothetical protein
MKKRTKDAMAGWMASLIILLYVSPRTGIVAVATSFVLSFLIGSLGGILLGRRHDGFIWPALGGSAATIAAVAVYILQIRFGS